MERLKIEDKKGFSLIELIVVVAIIAILAGVAVPYYNDYIIDSRTAALKQNVAALRRAMEDFRGTYNRYPFRGTVYRKAADAQPYICSFTSGLYNELAAGVVPNLNASYTDRRNKALQAWPVLIDPYTGEQIIATLGSTLLYFCDAPGGHAGIYDMDTDGAFLDLNFNGKWDGASIDESASGSDAFFGAAVATYPADVSDIIVIDSQGRKY